MKVSIIAHRTTGSVEIPEMLREAVTVPERFVGQVGEYRPVLRFDDGRAVAAAEDWVKRRREILENWCGVMGMWPAVIERPGVRYVGKESVGGMTRCAVDLELAVGVVRQAYLMLPKGKGPFPAVLVVYYDPETSAGLKGADSTRAFGYQLAGRGFVTLSIGDPGVLDKGRPGLDAEAVKLFGDVQPISWLAYCAANAERFLAGQPSVDADRIGVVGHSFGGKWAMMASCLWEKFACAAWSDPGIVWNEADGNANWWEPWYLGYKKGRQREKGLVTEMNPRTGAYAKLVADGRDLHELHALMAPRPFLVSGGAQDPVGHWTALNHAIGVNALLGYEDRVGMTNRDGHGPTAESNSQMYAFFGYWLSSRRGR